MIFLNELTHQDMLDGVRGVIFDCDGVLIDSLKANVWYYNSFRKHFGLEPMSSEDEHYVHIHSVYESLAHILPEGTHDEAWAMKQNFNYADVIPHLKMEEGLRELLHWLMRQNIRMAVNTNRSDTMDLVLDRFDLFHYFQPVITSFTVTNSKPHPESLFRILDQWRMDLDEAVFIGDSIVDESTAKAAGMEFWSYKNPMLDGRFMIPDFQTLLALFKRNSRGRQNT